MEPGSSQPVIFVLRLVLIPVTFLLCSAWAFDAQAQQTPQGFAVERFYPSAAGSGWFVMDDLNMHGGFGGALGLSSAYARKPLQVRRAAADGTRSLALVSDQVSAELSVAATYDRFRLYVGLPVPLLIKGDSGTLDGFELNAPAVDPGKNPDTISDPRVGCDVRLLGEPGDALRLGLGAELITSSGNRAEYVTDGTFRGMFRALFAGDWGRFAYAGHLGLHFRRLDDSTVPGSPRGSEFMFGFGGGYRFPINPAWAWGVGSEIYGESAFRSLFGRDTTGVEGLLTGKLEGTGDVPQLRVKIGAGGGFAPHFGAPEWRVILGVELFSRAR